MFTGAGIWVFFYTYRADGCAPDPESRVMARLEAKTHRVTRWRTSDQKLRWFASALRALERQFRRVKAYRHLPLLKQALQTKLSPTKSAAA